ncbi:hypothetical protein NDU88_009351 [Pleurodeles waltl]|uniref:Uncharacterized protein n=1 Tax=Pleurodeles waltl TaxID=8319 RepID=A0AAV7PYS2_PLEWA|nr:hypothetical protein NDU88_009351 [Pleurodeles waltl]
MVKSCLDPDAPGGWGSRVPGFGGHLAVMGVFGTRFWARTALRQRRRSRGLAGIRWSDVGCAGVLWAAWP